MAVCGYCGVEADVTITDEGGTKKHRHTFNALECRYLVEQAANKPEGAAITGECPHLEKAVAEELAELRGED